MRKFLTLLGFGILIYTNANGTTVNCSNGECEFNYSNHYKYAKTYCLQTLNFEQVETQTLSFTILKTGQECKVTESRQEN
jgi:hypothetical protein